MSNKTIYMNEETQARLKRLGAGTGLPASQTIAKALEIMEQRDRMKFVIQIKENTVVVSPKNDESTYCECAKGNKRVILPDDDIIDKIAKAVANVL